MPSNTVYVGRPTPYANPFKVRLITASKLTERPGKKHWVVSTKNDSRHWYCSSEAVARRFAVWAFRHWINSPEVWRYRNLDALRGKNLACWCRLDQPCHADVLLEIANA